MSGQPSTWWSSFTPIGTPPSGSETSAVAARSSTPSASTNEKAFRSLARMAASVSSAS